MKNNSIFLLLICLIFSSCENESGASDQEVSILETNDLLWSENRLKLQKIKRLIEERGGKPNEVEQFELLIKILENNAENDSASNAIFLADIETLCAHSDESPIEQIKLLISRRENLLNQFYETQDYIDVGLSDINQRLLHNMLIEIVSKQLGASDLSFSSPFNIALSSDLKTFKPGKEVSVVLANRETASLMTYNNVVIKQGSKELKSTVIKMDNAVIVRFTPIDTVDLKVEFESTISNFSDTLKGQLDLAIKSN
jgi:hypothetical protein